MNMMKNIFCMLSISAMLLPVTVLAQAPESSTLTNDVIKISDLTYDSDADAHYFTVSIEGEKEGQNYVNYQMDITLPNGISYDYTAGGSDEPAYWVEMYEDQDQDFYPFTKTGNKIKFDHNFEFEFPESNRLRVLCYTTKNIPFKSKNGKLFYAYVKVDNEVFASSFSPKPLVTVTKVRISNEDGKLYHINDFTSRPFSTGIASERNLKLYINASNQVGTLILPFSAELPQGVKAYTCAAVDAEEEDLLSLVPASSFEACKPYLVYAPNGYDGTLSGTVDMSRDYPLDDIYSEGMLTGVLKTTVVNSGYIMQNQGDGPMFYNAEGSSFSLNAGRCYLTPAQSASIKAYAFDFGQANAIEGVTDSKPADGNGVIYDLTGRPVVAPAQGMYIFNGKKIFVK